MDPRLKLLQNQLNQLKAKQAQTSGQNKAISKKNLLTHKEESKRVSFLNQQVNLICYFICLSSAQRHMDFINIKQEQNCLHCLALDKVYEKVYSELLTKPQLAGVLYTFWITVIIYLELIEGNSFTHSDLVSLVLFFKSRVLIIEIELQREYGRYNESPLDSILKVCFYHYF
ncbi:unnamed protein product [Paramecium octaurelia]|uniref:Uncharacterized protein n=1 Tax=Paramecium octaurelia TaxID=43137 RepID=A0A8S1YN60_PAROT|nr:unnamed protein product [Paramecium octaurelia]